MARVTPPTSGAPAMNHHLTAALAHAATTDRHLGEGATHLVHDSVRRRQPPRAVIAGEQWLWREALRRLLVGAGFDVVGHADGGEDLLRKVSAHRPDLVVTDVGSARSDAYGLRAVITMRQRFPRT